MKSSPFPGRLRSRPFAGPSGPIGPFAAGVAALILCAAFAGMLAGCERLIYPGTTYGYPGKIKARPPAAEKGGVPSKAAVARPAERRILVRRGDTLFAISRAYKVPLRTLIEANRLKPPYHLRAGTHLTLPAVRTHTVVKGDTVYGISRRYDVNMSQLVRHNGIAPPFKIKVGQVLRLPASIARSAAAAKGEPRAAAPPPPGKTFSAPRGAKRPASYAPPPPRAGRQFHWPLRGKLEIPFGPSSGGLHNDGINILAKRGASVEAAENGVVVYAGNELRGFGNLLLIKHADGWMSAYAHNEKILVRRGQRVKRGDVIARVGSTGNVSKPQLHFELRKGSRVVDPRKYLSA